MMRELKFIRKYLFIEETACEEMIPISTVAKLMRGYYNSRVRSKKKPASNARSVSK